MRRTNARWNGSSASSGVEPAERAQEDRIAGAAAVQHRDRLGGEDVRVPAQQPRQAAVDRHVVDAVAELVEHRPEPALARLDVREDPHVVAAVDLDAERVLVLVRARVEVAAREDALDRVAERVEVGARDRERIESGERRLERVAVDQRRVLEERLGVVPRPQLLVRGNADPRSLRLVDRALLTRPCVAEQQLETIEQSEEPALVELLQLERHREVVAVPEAASRLVARACQLAHLRGGAGADLLRGVPGSPPRAAIARVAQDRVDLVVRDRTSIDGSAMLGVERREARLEPDDALGKLPRSLVRAGLVAQDREPARADRVVRLLGGCEPRVAIRIGQRVLERHRGLDHALLHALVAADRGVPLRQGPVAVEGSELRLGLVQDGDDRRHRATAYRSGGAPSARASSSGRAVATSMSSPPRPRSIRTTPRFGSGTSHVQRSPLPNTGP